MTGRGLSAPIEQSCTDALSVGAASSGATAVRYTDAVAGDGHDPVLHELAQRARAQLDVLVRSTTDEILAQMEIYSSQTTVTRDELTRSVSANMITMLASLSNPTTVDLAQARTTGLTRARQGVPLPEVLRAFRIGFSDLWATLLDLAASSGEAQLRTIIATSSRFWFLIDQFLEAVTVAYREATAELARAQRQRRAALLEALLSGGVSPGNAVWEVALQLGLPPEGTFVVVAADTGELASSSLTGIERTLADDLFVSAWRLTPSYELGIVALADTEQLPRLVEILDAQALLRIGISPPFQGLEHTPRALHLAHVARSSIADGQTRVVCFDDAPLSVLIAAGPDEAMNLARQVLAPILALPATERDLLIDTADAWIAGGGSAKHAAVTLFCHPNTVRYRLHRIEGDLGLSFADPGQAAQIVVALRAWSMFGRVRP